MKGMTVFMLEVNYLGFIHPTWCQENMWCTCMARVISGTCFVPVINSTMAEKQRSNLSRLHLNTLNFD